jgi:hypothetical protein
MRRFKQSFGIPAGAKCGDRVGRKWLLFMRRIYDLDLAREIAAAEGPSALVVDDGPQCWAVVVLDRTTRNTERLARRHSQSMGPARMTTTITRKQTTFFDNP